MELSETTLAHLRDEAYAAVAREALVAKLEALEQTRTAVEDTRPPFGVLARRESREAFARSLRGVDEDSAALRDQLAQITGIAEWLHPRIRNDVSTYLASVSPDYCNRLQVAARLDDWERSYRAVPELLTAFARDLRALRAALTAGKKHAPSITYELAVLRESAERLSCQRQELNIIEQAANALVPAGSAPISFPVLPDLLRLAWVSRLAVLLPDVALAEVMRVEPEIRALLDSPSDPILSQLQAIREQCGAVAYQTLEEYWNQLRAHARAHYLEQREVADIISMLSACYVDSELRRHQDAVNVAAFTSR